MLKTLRGRAGELAFAGSIILGVVARVVFHAMWHEWDTLDTVSIVLFVAAAYLLWAATRLRGTQAHEELEAAVQARCAALEEREAFLAKRIDEAHQVLNVAASIARQGKAAPCAETMGTVIELRPAAGRDEADAAG